MAADTLTGLAMLVMGPDVPAQSTMLIVHTTFKVRCRQHALYTVDGYQFAGIQALDMGGGNGALLEHIFEVIWHGYSDQYILELECFLKAAAKAGLTPDPVFQRKYPDSDLATISLNLLKG